MFKIDFKFHLIQILDIKKAKYFYLALKLSIKNFSIFGNADVAGS